MRLITRLGHSALPLSPSPIVVSIRERQRELISNELFSELRRAPDFGLLVDQRLIKISVRTDGFELEAGPFVGTIQLSQHLTLAIVEKAPGALDALMSLAHGREIRLLNAEGHFGPRLQGSAPMSWMQQAIWSMFVAEAKTYVLTQMEADYKNVVNFGSRPRGKILLKPSIRRAFAHGQRGRLYYKTHQLTRDTELNQLVKYALSIVASASSNPTLHDLAISAGYLLYHLSDVKLAADARNAHLLVSEARSTLVELATAVIEDIIPLHAFESAILFPLAAFIRLERLFETAVFEVIRSACSASQGYKVERYGTAGVSEYVLRDTSSFEAKPDIVVRGAGQLVIDAKYRDFSKEVPHDALYQIISHCEAFGMRDALLVGLAEEAQPLTKLLGTTRSGIRITAALVHPSKLEEQLRPTIGKILSKAESPTDLSLQKIA